MTLTSMSSDSRVGVPSSPDEMVAINDDIQDKNTSCSRTGLILCQDSCRELCQDSLTNSFFGRIFRANIKSLLAGVIISFFLITVEPNNDLGELAPAWFPAWPEPMAYRHPQITVLVASFFVALGSGTNYVCQFASLLNNWIICLLDIFRCRYSFWFRWILADASEFLLLIAYSPQLGSRLNISYTQLNIIGLAGNGKQYLYTLNYILMFFFFLFSWGVYFCSDLGKDGGCTRSSDRFYSQFRVHLGWIFWHQIPIRFWPTTWLTYSANSQLLHASSL